MRVAFRSDSIPRITELTKIRRASGMATVCVHARITIRENGRCPHLRAEGWLSPQNGPIGNRVLARRKTFAVRTPLPGCHGTCVIERAFGRTPTDVSELRF